MLYTWKVAVKIVYCSIFFLQRAFLAAAAALLRWWKLVFFVRNFSSFFWELKNMKIFKNFPQGHDEMMAVKIHNFTLVAHILVSKCPERCKKKNIFNTHRYPLDLFYFTIPSEYLNFKLWQQWLECIQNSHNQIFTCWKNMDWHLLLLLSTSCAHAHFMLSSTTTTTNLLQT